jgi:hypothetical protein
MPHDGSYRSTEEFQLAADGLYGFCGLLLFAFAKQQCDTKNLILRNFIARTSVSVRGVMQLWLISDVQDCWVLHRCLMDRFFHLRHLGAAKEYDLFDDWSFYEQYNALNRVRSDQDFGAEHRTAAFSPTPEQKARYTKLSKNPPQFKRPKAEDVAKGMDLSFLYKYGYDYGSRHVHPMSDDGGEDFFAITKLDRGSELPDQRSVISNSILVGCLIVQEALNQSSFRWRAVVYDFLGQLMSHLENGSMEYGLAMQKVMYFAPGDLCEPLHPDIQR